MVSRAFIFVLLCSSLIGLSGQNLVPNPSFEIYSALPDDYGQIGRAIPWMPFFNSTEYFHEDAPVPLYALPSNAFGYQWAHSGKACAGMAFANRGHAREYLEVMLQQPLDSGVEYGVSFYVSFYDWYPQLAIQEMTALFTTDTFRPGPIHPPVIYQPVPQFIHRGGIIDDTLDWVRVEGSFIAEGGEAYLTIGAYVPPDSLHSRIFPKDTFLYTYYPACYFIDDVSVWDRSIPTYPAQAGGRRLICVGKEVQLGWYDAAYHSYEWSLDRNFSTVISTEARPRVSPLVSTWYYLRVTDFTFRTSVDSVLIRVDDCFEYRAPNVFTPNYDGVNDRFRAELSDALQAELQIFDRRGVLVFEGPNEPGWDGRTRQGNEAAEGVYFYVIGIHSPELGIRKNYRGTVTLLR